jgi:hypothetical protein
LKIRKKRYNFKRLKIAKSRKSRFFRTIWSPGLLTGEIRERRRQAEEEKRRREQEGTLRRERQIELQRRQQELQAKQKAQQDRVDKLLANAAAWRQC